MTLEDIEQIPKNFLTSADVAPYLEMDPHALRIAAHEDPNFLGFRVVVTNRRVRIPKDLFVQHFRGKE